MIIQYINQFIYNKIRESKMQLNFYSLYNEYNKKNKYDIFRLDKNLELYKFIPITINYRTLYNNDLFCIKYTIEHYCTGHCKFSKKLKEIKISRPFIDIPDDYIQIIILTIYKNYF